MICLSTLTHFKLRCKAAAGDSQVVGVLLTVQQVHVCIPQFEVSSGAASHKHLATRGEAAGHDTGLAHWAASVNHNNIFLTWPGLEQVYYATRRWTLSGMN